MAEQPKGNDPKTLEMRVAELEDRLSKMHITEDEMKAYHKVASLVAGASKRSGRHTGAASVSPVYVRQ